MRLINREIRGSRKKGGSQIALIVWHPRRGVPDARQLLLSI